MSDLTHDEVIKALQGLVDDLGNESVDRLTELKGAYAAGLALYQREAARQAELPPNESRRRRLQAHVQQAPMMIAELAFEIEARSSSFRKAPPGVLSIDGRATDERGLGVGGLAVTVEDEAGNRIPGIDRATTAEDGSFAVQVPPALAEKLAKAETRGFVTVRTARGQTVVHRDDTPLDFGLQAGRTVNVSIRRTDFHPPRPAPSGTTGATRATRSGAGGGAAGTPSAPGAGKRTGGRAKPGGEGKRRREK